MKSIGDAGVLAGLIGRIERLTPDARARWGSLTPPEMLCHLGDAGDGVLKRRIPPGSVPGKPRPRVLKWVMLYTPIPFPKGVETRAGVDPRREGTRPTAFDADRKRVIDGLRALASAAPGQLSTSHFRFGEMSVRDWHHWAYKHVDHHLRQFGV